MKRALNGREFLSDLHSGLTETELMEKYRITSRCLQSLYRKLLNAGVLSRDDLKTEIRASLYSSTVELHALRNLPRESVVCPLLIYAEDEPDRIGRVMDISVAGVGTMGLLAKEGDQKTLIIAADKFFNVGRIVLSVVCRWTKTDTSAQALAGWEILFLDKDSEQELVKLIQSLSISFCSGTS